MSDKDKRELPRPCSVNGLKATCHLLYVQCWTHAESPMVGGFPAGQESLSAALVEYQDGTMESVDAKFVRFTDIDIEDGDAR